MPIKVTDSIFPVIIEGADQFGNKLVETINVTETLKDGLDMAYYSAQCNILQPKFSHVENIVWRQAMPLRRVIDKKWLKDHDLSFFDQRSREMIDGKLSHSSQTNSIWGGVPEPATKLQMRQQRWVLELPKS